MKENTYNIPAYKFALVKFDNDILKYKYSSDYFSNYLAKNAANCHLIPFENLDGLTINELKSLFSQDHCNFFMISYTSITIEDIHGHKTINNNIKFSLLLNDLKAGIDDNKRIDEVIRDFMLATYDSYNADVKKVFACFLERYCYQNREETTNIIRSRK